MGETITEHGGAEEPVVESAAEAVSDEQLIAVLVDRARNDGLQLTGEGGLLQQLTKRVWSPPWRARSPTTSAMTSTTRRAGTAATPVPTPRPC